MNVRYPTVRRYAHYLSAWRARNSTTAWAKRSLRLPATMWPAHNPEVAGSTPAPAAASTRVVPSCSVEWPVGDAHLVRILSLRRNRCETNCFGTDATLGSTAGGSRSRYESSSLVERHGNAVIVISAAARRAARRRSEILDTTVRKCQRQFVVKLHPVVLMS